MARTVTEWIGKNDDARPPKSCQLRILDRQDNKCALSGHVFVPGDKIEFDHIVPLWLHGENREKNLHAVLGEPHKRKTKAEAAVRAKINRQTARNLGITKPAGKLRGPAFPKPDKPERSSKAALPPKRIYAARTSP
ncbi:HNH endonuclease [Mesorhizobium sp. B263B2A]|uniref:HNH endonuclease n=1 Tax=Mesorhizobium sp. B263B2A TaxID=2876669 RepID=UPI001CD158AC|nr:HNH endonuclease [Mesorhizobium sp. B263B2A]MCA0032702.1 HNH endonuclease [Mesorhizobium sp. B263B2A]